MWYSDDFELEELNLINNYYSKWQIKEAEERKNSIDKSF